MRGERLMMSALKSRERASTESSPPFTAPTGSGAQALAQTSRTDSCGVRSRLYTVEHGARGPLLVFLPGIGGTTRYWTPRVLPLARDHRLLIVDLLGFGRSPKPWTRYTVDRHLRDLRATLGHRGPFTLAGHSFGAILAVAYAAAHPDQVRQLVLVSLPFFGSESAARSHFRNGHSVERWMMWNLLFASLACVATRRVLRRWLPGLLPDMPREVVEDLVEHTWRSFTSSVWEGIYRYDLQAAADRLPTELGVLCLHGQVDPTAPLGGVRSLRMRYPAWSLSVLGGADHHPLLRDPAWCRAWIRRAVAA